MAFASMNGRLKSIPACENNEKAPDKINYNGNVDRDLSFSAIPCTLPHGLLTFHNGRPKPILNKSSSCSSDYVYHDQQVTRNTYDKFGIAEIHRSMGDIIIDHCWTKVKVNPIVNEKNDEDNYLETFLVLAMLTRRREKTVAEIDGNMAVTMLNVYWRKLNIDSYGGSGGVGTSPDDDFDSSIDETFPVGNKRSLTFPCTINNIVMNESIIVLGSSAGAIIYSIHEIIRVKSDERFRNDDDSTIDSASQSVPISSERIHHGHGLRNLKLMTTFIIHTMDISSFHFVAVSGNRVGVWNVQKLKQALLYMDAQTSHHIPKKPTAEWSTKIEGKMGRITCVELLKADTVGQDAKYIALSDWNGSAFVFRRQDEGIPQWQRVRHPQSESLDSAKGDINSDPLTIDKDDLTAPSWEEAASSKKYHRGNENHNITAPTFVTICKIHVPGFTHAVSVMAVSTPCSGIISIYDLDHQCPWTDTRTITDVSNCGEGKSKIESILTLCEMCMTDQLITIWMPFCLSA